MSKLIHIHRASKLGATLMPRWFFPVLAITTVVMVLSGLRVARDNKVVSP